MVAEPLTTLEWARPGRPPTEAVITAEVKVEVGEGQERRSIDAWVDHAVNRGYRYLPASKTQ